MKSYSVFEVWNKLGGFKVLLSFRHPDVQPDEECVFGFAFFSVCKVRCTRDEVWVKERQCEKTGEKSVFSSAMVCTCSARLSCSRSAYFAFILSMSCLRYLMS